MEPIMWEGIAASPGYALSKAVVLQQESFVPTRDEIEDAATEIIRFKAVVDKAVAELEDIRDSVRNRLGESKAEIFEGHLMLLKDPELIDAIINLIQDEKINTEAALYETAQSFIDMFQGMDNELLRARAIDIKDIRNRLMNHLRGLPYADLTAINEDCVIIAEDLTPSDTASLNLQFVKGIINATGSRTSHSAIMARSLEIPAIVGTGTDILELASSTMVILDAKEGIVLAHPTEEQLVKYSEKADEFKQQREALNQLKEATSVTLDGHQVELAANIGKLEDLVKVLDNGAEGIGQFRTEFLYMERSSLPSEEDQFNIYKHVLQRMGSKPVVIRTLDIGGDKDLPYLELPKESNPFLGQRALRLCLNREELFRTQLRALLRAGAYGSLKIMFPMIAVMEEWYKAKQILVEEQQALIEQGVIEQYPLEVGMMIEVPSAAISAEIFASEVDFFSIGTNDLIQYTMAADRMNESVSYLYQPCHPSVLKLIDNVIKAAHKNNIWVGMCGEMAGNVSAIPLLVGMGLDEFSMSAGSILPARAQVRQLQYGELVSFAEQALSLRTESEVQQHLAKLNDE